MRWARLPLTYDESRARFRHAARGAGAEVVSHPIGLAGPHGTDLTIDVVALGAASPDRALLVLSGVHGVEGFIGSALQADLLARLKPTDLAPGTGIVLVHAVNPWGMAWWRRQNEHNVDLNRNWRRSDTTPLDNPAYDELHPLACPDSETRPSVEALLEAADALVERRGLAWVRDAITLGQYRHPDGLHYGGSETETSNRVLEGVAADHLGAAELVVILDLHTGHGPHGAVTLLSDQPPDSPQDRFWRRAVPDATVEATVDNDDATTGNKSGQIANGIRSERAGRCFSTSVEFGTTPDLEQLAATYLEQWAYRHDRLSDPDHADLAWRYRCCFTPDDEAWEQTAMASGRRVLLAGLAAVGRSPHPEVG